MKHGILTLFILLCLVSAGCTSPSGSGNPGTAAPAEAPDSGFVLNESIRPGDDFYTYVNDAWLREHPVPDDKTYYGMFSELQDKTDDNLHALLLNASNAAPGTADHETALLGEFYRSGMDNATIDRQGLLPLAGDLAMIDGIRSRADLTNATIKLQAEGYTPVYLYFADVNPKNSSEMIPTLYQGGLGLPDRDYYFRNDNESLKIKEAYQKHIARVFELSGEPAGQAAAHAGTVWAMEKTLAAAHFTPEENQDPQQTTNIYTPAELQKNYPAIGWDALVTLPGSGPVSRVNLYQPRYVAALDHQLTTAPLDDWKVYLKYQVINSAAPYISTPFEKEDFSFYKTTLYGVEEMKPRWKLVVRTESDLMGDLVGKAYVAGYVDPRTRAMVSEMFLSIRQAFDGRIENVAWMSNATKAAAHTKLAAMGEKIAYPDTWMDYTGLELSDSYAGNVRSVSAYNFIHGPYGLDKVGKPVDVNAWEVSPQTVNAFYNPTKNEIIFPAAFLQPPAFDPDADPAVNYGALGFFIGHEMTHGFDNSGRQYDRDGNLRDWWTTEDAAKFNNQTAILVTQYNSYEVLPGLTLNGNLTLGENIADFGGLTLAYHAWKESVNPSPGTIISDKTADRQFFFSAARAWRENARDEALRNWVYIDPHSANKYRVNGVVFNIPEFYDAFPEVQPGDALYRNVSERPVIW